MKRTFYTELSKVFGVLLVVAETRPSFTLRFGEGGEITPGWAFAFALLLLRSPLSAMALSAVATLTAEVLARKSFIKIVFNVSQVSLSLGLGTLVLLGQILDLERRVEMLARPGQ